jgi:hypothetical protein
MKFPYKTEPFRFYLGVHHPKWLSDVRFAGIPLLCRGVNGSAPMTPRERAIACVDYK